MKALFLLLATLGAFADFSGSYKGEYGSLTVDLSVTQTGSKLVAEAKLQGTAIFNLDGTVEGDKASGKATLGEDTAEFRGTLSGDTLTLELAEKEDGKVDWSSAEKIVFKRSATGTTKSGSKLANAIGKANAEARTDVKAAPSAMLKDGKLYEHASGGKFRYPASWSLKEIEGALQLTPADAKPGEEVYIAAESAAGKTDPADPEVLAYLDSLVQAFYPQAKRVGKPEPARAGTGKGTDARSRHGR